MKRIRQIKKNYHEKFPHIPFLLPVILSSVAFIIILLEFYITKELKGIGLNIATEIGGILITLLLVDYFIQKNREKEWENVHNNVKASILGLLTGFDVFLLILLKKLDKEVDKSGNIYKVLIDNFDAIYPKLDTNEFESAINQISHLIEKHIDGILSDIKLNPKPEYVKEIIGIRNLTNFLASWPNFVNSPIYKNVSEPESMNKFLSKSFKSIIWHLSVLDKKLLFDYAKENPNAIEYIAYLAFDKLLGIDKDAQEVRDMILKKYNLEDLKL